MDTTTKRIPWQSLGLVTGDGYKLHYDERVEALREFRQTDDMGDVFFEPCDLPHEDPESASTFGPRRPEDVDWTGFPTDEREQLSLSAVAALMGTTRQNIGNKVARSTFPAPDGRIVGGDPYWLRSTVLLQAKRDSIERKLGVSLAAGIGAREAATIRAVYQLTDDMPIGAQLSTLGHLTEEEGTYLDSVLKGGAN